MAKWSLPYELGTPRPPALTVAVTRLTSADTEDGDAAQTGGVSAVCCWSPEGRGAQSRRPFDSGPNATLLRRGNADLVKDDVKNLARVVGAIAKSTRWTGTTLMGSGQWAYRSFQAGHSPPAAEKRTAYKMPAGGLTIRGEMARSIAIAPPQPPLSLALNPPPGD